MNDDNVTHIINRETVGLDQLAGFDSVGQAGPGVTFEIACREVRRLVNKHKWISVEDRLPEDKINVLFIKTWGPKQSTNIYIGWQSCGSWYEQTLALEIHGDVYATADVANDYVTHWMPLPEPPESDDAQSL